MQLMRIFVKSMSSQQKDKRERNVKRQEREKCKGTGVGKGHISEREQCKGL